MTRAKRARFCHKRLPRRRWKRVAAMSGRGVPLGGKGLWPSLKKPWGVFFIVENQDLSEKH